jgi:hypothetical protein
LVNASAPADSKLNEEASYATHWRFVICRHMILLSPVATYQLWLVSPKTGRSTYIPTGGKGIMTRFVAKASL